MNSDSFYSLEDGSFGLLCGKELLLAYVLYFICGVLLGLFVTDEMLRDNYIAVNYAGLVGKMFFITVNIGDYGANFVLKFIASILCPLGFLISGSHALANIFSSDRLLKEWKAFKYKGKLLLYSIFFCVTMTGVAVIDGKDFFAMTQFNTPFKMGTKGSVVLLGVWLSFFMPVILIYLSVKLKRSGK
ncbi:MAG: hypothetical protein WCP79_05840 [Bacillota bacterium]